jgi:peptidoglycan/LPS O-acetylase OafA/YrhL
MNRKLQSLRGVSIIGVLLYHFDLLGATGYLGVDVFFVISGYLVYRKLFKSGEYESRLTIAKEFLLARFFRIYPALITTVLIITILSVAFLSPIGEIQNTSKALILSLAGGSNYFLATNIGNYFDNYAKTSPVLHLWSLSVEFQAWILMLVVYLVVRKLRSPGFRTIAFFSMYSIISVVIYGIEINFFQSYHGEAINFYGFSHRAYEFLLGALAAELGKKFTKSNVHWGLQRASLYGIAYVLFISTHDSKVLTYTVLSLSALHLVVAANQQCDWVETKLAQIGDYAYLLYLIHWPILVFTNRLILDSQLAKVVAFTLTLLGIPLLRIIETRFVSVPSYFRQPSIEFKKFFPIVVISLAMVFSLLPGLLARGGGFDDQVREIYSSKKRSDDNCHNQANSLQFKKCASFSSIKQDSIDLMLLGDSHAAGFTTALINFAKSRQLTFFISTNSGCSGINVNRMQEGFFINCKSYAQYVENNISRLQPKLILISARWANYLNSFPRVAGEPLEIDDTCLTDFLEETNCPILSDTSLLFKTNFAKTLLHAPDNSKIAILLDYPEFNREFETCEFLYRLKRDCFVNSTSNYVKRQRVANDYFRSIESDRVLLIDGTDFFCGKWNCESYRMGKNLYYDSQHLNTTGSSLYFNELLAPVLTLHLP